MTQVSAVEGKEKHKSMKSMNDVKEFITVILNMSPLACIGCCCEEIVYQNPPPNHLGSWMFSSYVLKCRHVKVLISTHTSWSVRVRTYKFEVLEYAYVNWSVSSTPRQVWNVTVVYLYVTL